MMSSQPYEDTALSYSLTNMILKESMGQPTLLEALRLRDVPVKAWPVRPGQPRQMVGPVKTARTLPKQAAVVTSSL